MYSKRIVGLVTLIAGLAVGVSQTQPASAATARPSGLECPSGASVIINPNSNPLYFPVGSSNPEVSATRTNTFASIGPGVFTVVSYLSWDGYAARVNTTQLNEQWAVEIVGSTSVRTGLTTDVADRVEEASSTGALAPIETTGGFVHFIHSSIYPNFTTDGSFNSVHPIGFCYTLTDLAATTTTTTTTTTLPKVEPQPCVTIKRYVRSVGSTEWLDAQTPEGAALIALGGTAEYQIVTTNCGNTTLTNVTIVDSISGCNHLVPGSMAPGSSNTFNSSSADGSGCQTVNVTVATCGVSTVTAQPVVDGQNVGPILTAFDPACIVPAAAVTTTVATTVATTKVATTVATTIATTVPVLLPVVTPAPTPPPSVPAVTLAPTVAPAATSVLAATVPTVPVATTIAGAVTTEPRLEVLGETVAQATEGDLPVTGGDTGMMLTLAALMVLMGLALLLSSTRKRA